MSKWILNGLLTRVKTTAYPRRPDHTPGISPGLPEASTEFLFPEAAGAAAAVCPSGALKADATRLKTDQQRCIHCMRCAWGATAVPWDKGYQWGRWTRNGSARKPAQPFGHSVHIRVVDGGGCDACLLEVQQLTNPYYNMHRLGFFLTPSPRHADVLLVVGPVTRHMRRPLLKTYEAMPEPRWVVAAGSCALTGGPFGPSFATLGGVADVLPVDIEVPGCPPPPLAILHALLLLTGRAEQADMQDPKALSGVIR